MKTLARGFTMIELIVVLAIAALLAAAVTPMINEYSVNSRLREAGSLLLADALYAQSEALKRNERVRLDVTSAGLKVTVVSSNDQLRQRDFPPDVYAAGMSLEFGGAGRPATFGTGATVDLGHASLACTSQHRCPRLVIDGGGGVRLCPDKLTCSSL
jgi:type IV fimbrial biogenesis protein FimT